MGRRPDLGRTGPAASRGGRPASARGEFIEHDILDHRVRVCDPLQQGRVFLAGDAAHLITPAGGKGMNMAIQDAVELAGGLTERYGQHGTAIAWPATRRPGSRTSGGTRSSPT